MTDMGDINLRPHQVEASDATVTAIRAGRNPLVTMATATGKTYTFVDVVRRVLKKNQRALVVTHRLEIIEQIAASVERLGMSVDVEQGKRRARRSSSVVVSSVQTMSKTKSRWPRDAFAVMIIDEAHHSVAKSYKGIVERFDCPVAGFTATPDRLDGEHLGQVFDHVAYDLNIAVAVERGLIAPIVQRSIRVDSIDVSMVKERNGDLTREELSSVLTGIEALQGVAVPLLDCIGNRRTIVFTPTVEHARVLTRVLNRMRDGCAEVVSGEDSADFRAATLAEFEAGRFQILVNCELFTEGFDSPSVSCIAMARPTKSRALYQQCVGRGTRLHPDKENVLVLDFCGNAGEHQLITAIDLFARKTDSAKVIRDAKEISARDPEVMIAAHVALELARQLPGEVIESYSVTKEEVAVAVAVPTAPAAHGRCASCRKSIVGKAVPSRGDLYCHHCWLNAKDVDARLTRMCSRCKFDVTGKSYTVSNHKDVFCNSCWTHVSTTYAAKEMNEFALAVDGRRIAGPMPKPLKAPRVRGLARAKRAVKTYGW